ncbi:MAG TPA: methyltransferase domain-containing protein [Kiloniellaceae bacterium]|nr:methyltransferase domain-containing protein [Kiloniellaceae bacterium]
MTLDFGSLGRTVPVSRHFGFDRGTPIDRLYIDDFLARHALDIQGRTLEIGDDGYCRRFGGVRTTQRDVLHAHGDNPKATIVGDLTQGENIPSDSFDCCVITQTLHIILDSVAAVRTLHRILKPGGVLLATFPGTSQVSLDEWTDSWHWSFSRRWAERCFGETFEAAPTIVTYGNLFAATCFLQGIAAEEVALERLTAQDPDFDVLIAVRVQKAGGNS